MKGTLHKTNRGWVVKQVVKEGPQARLINQYPLIDNGHIDGLKLYDSNEGLEVDFEIVDEIIDLGRHGSTVVEYAKLIFQTKPGFVEKRMNQMLEHLANEAFKNVGDEGLFPNHTDKDIWTAGFKAGYLKK